MGILVLLYSKIRIATKTRISKSSGFQFGTIMVPHEDTKPTVSTTTKSEGAVETPKVKQEELKPFRKEPKLQKEIETNTFQMKQENTKSVKEELKFEKSETQPPNVKQVEDYKSIKEVQFGKEIETPTRKQEEQNIPIQEQTNPEKPPNEEKEILEDEYSSTTQQVDFPHKISYRSSSTKTLDNGEYLLRR